MTRGVQDSQRAGFKLEFGFITQFSVLTVFERIGILAYAFIHFAHRIDLRRRNAGANQQGAMFGILKSADAVAGLPIVDQHLRIFSFIAQ